MEIVLAIIAALLVAALFAIAGLAWRRILSWLGHPTAEERIARLEKVVGRIADWADGIPTTDNKQLKAAYQEARILQLGGYAAQSAEKHQEAIDRFTRALALAETDSQRAALHNLRGNSYFSISRYKEAEADYKETLKLAERISPADEALRVRAVALGNLGNIYAERGDLDKAEGHHRQALEMHREMADRLGEAIQLGNLGLVHADRGDLNKAEGHHKQALEIDREIGNRLEEANQLGNLGNVYAERGDLERSEEHYQQALEIDREIGNRLGEAQDLCNLGSVYYQRGELDEAEEHLKRALEIDREIGNRLEEANQLGNLGLVYADRGEPDKAREYLQQAQDIYQEIGAGGEGPEKVREALEELERQQQEHGEEQHPEG